ncbi:MAG: diguanylate cyclase [Pirellulaceae bacterium]
MNRLPATIRISLGLTLLSVSLLLVLHTLGVGPDEHGANLRGRREFCEALAIHSSLLVSRGEFGTLKESLTGVINRYPDIWAIDLQEDNGRVALHLVDRQIGSLANLSRDYVTTVSVPLVADNGLWGAIKVSFRPLVAPWLGTLWSHPTLKFLLLLAVANGVIFFLYLKRNLQHLDPSRVVPERVRNALDSIPAGLVIVDRQERILLANKCFAAAVKKLPSELQGCSLARFDWQDRDGTPLGSSRPWRKSIQEGAACEGLTVILAQDSNDPRCYSVRSSPIAADDGFHRGALISFEDVTELETKRVELTRALEVLRTSRDEVRKQNDHLQHLATTDPLTDCLNRRSFYEALETHWNSAQRYNHALSFVMVDLDHFKSINDTHGHSVGDLVLQKAAKTLQKSVRPSDLVCRYGGEEFCILLPQTDLDQAVMAAERYRRAIEALQLPELTVTASFGVSSIQWGAADAQAMIDHADKCLYVAKRQGRNQIVRWDEVPDDVDVDASRVPHASDEDGLTAPEHSTEIPFHAVSALVSALAYRDVKTAEHSRRVADLCVITASGMMSARECYVLEIAATLHDIGKIGVPDSILLKPGPLTKEEWEVMGDHDQFGIQIIDSAFASPALTEIIENHHAWYAGNPRQPGLPTGEDIPLGARILTIADAYDAIVSDRVYRKSRSQEEAFAELRRCSDTQFDRDLVERLIIAVKTRYETRARIDSRFSRQTAVALGQQIEQIAETLDKQDLRGLAALAGRMHQTAQQHEVSNLATIAKQLQHAAREQTDLQEIVNLTTELMDLCRSAQSSFLVGAGSRRRH